MKINLKKTKAILFNPCTSADFMPHLRLDNQEVEVVEELRLLGVIVRSDMGIQYREHGKEGKQETVDSEKA